MQLKYFASVAVFFSMLTISCSSDMEPVYDDGDKEILVSIDNVKFSEPSQAVEFDIRINPIDFNFNYNIDETDGDFRLHYVNPDKALNNGTLPVTLKSVVPSKNSAGKVIPGQYKITLQDNGDNILTYTESVYFSIRNTNKQGESVYYTSNVFDVVFDSQLPLILDTDIPIMDIKTPTVINSTLEWIPDCEITIMNSGVNDVSFNNVQMKGRGNSTWQAAKKPYAIKLDKKENILGFPKHKRWVLLANFYDKSNLRTELAFQMGRLSKGMTEPGLDYTPRSCYIRVLMNGEYLGLFQLTEQLKIDENRVDVGKDGFLLEIDARGGEDPSDIYFNTGHIANPILIKDPDMEEGDKNYNYIKNFIDTADATLFSDNFLDPSTGYKQFFDLESFIDWYIVNEVTKNNDAFFFSSCYMNLERGGKLKMGPIWDFDLSIGNYITHSPNEGSNDPEGFKVKDTQWYSRMFQDPEFVSLLKERFSFYFDHRQELYDYLDNQRDLISEALLENDMRWHFYTNPFNETTTVEKHIAECNTMKEWLEKRFQWMNAQISAM